jgi:hypothetical protein
MRLIACEIQGSLDTIRLEAPDDINKAKPGCIFARYGKYDSECFAASDDDVVLGQKISLKIGYDDPKEPTALAVIIGWIRESNP